MKTRKIVSGICCNGIVLGTAATAPGRTKTRMKTPIAYYGGKLNWLNEFYPKFQNTKFMLSLFLAEERYFLQRNHQKLRS